MHSPDTLRRHFPEFANANDYPDEQIEFCMSIADASLPQSRWRKMWDQGCELHTCHQLAISAQHQRAIKGRAIPGQVEGPATAKSVDKVSKSMDTGAVTHEGAGWYNLTSYGVQLYQMIRIVGAGGLQL